MKRLFIALPILEKTRLEIAQGILADGSVKKMPVRWTSVQNLHLTLQFLGDVEEKRIPVLKQILNRLGTSGTAEELTFTNVGAFPGAANPRVIWIGIKTNNILLKIQQQLTQDLIRNDFPADQKKFKPHLTLGRVKENAAVPADMIRQLEDLRGKLDLTSSPLDRVTLFESQLRPGGPLYTVLYEKKFL